MEKLDQTGAHPKVTFREFASTLFQVAPLATFVFVVPFVFAKLSDHMAVALPSILIAYVGLFFYSASAYVFPIC